MRIALAIGLLIPLGLSAQEIAPTLSREALVRLVLDHHPMARQAALRPELGVATVRSARGGFDPVVQAELEEKTFDDKDYFRLLDVGLKVPTWWGIEVLAGYQDNSGDLLDPMLTTPNDGLMKAGVNLALGQGMLMDQRRAALRRAQAFQDAALAEQEQMLNAVLFAALSDHVDWVAAHQALRIAQEAVQLARLRNDFVRGSWRGGDRPAIDTLEAFLQLQDREMRLAQAELNVRNTALRLSNHLWDQALRPLELDPATRPMERDLESPDGAPSLDSLVVRAERTHPLLLQAQARIDQLEVDRRLRAEMLRPQLDLKYMVLGDARRLNGESGSWVDGGDQQWGVGFRMPLLLRRERGELSLARLRVTEAELGLERDRTVIANRVAERANETGTLRQQTDLGALTVRNYGALLEGENRRFEVGESSLFLVNAREVALLEARIKQVDLEARLRKAWFATDLEAGVLWRTLTGQTP
ncbi:MAG: TolC family protein [Flavobacteriales bacterium]|nr:TolC family protein [Flavobacteriales bacterium]